MVALALGLGLVLKSLDLANLATAQFRRWFSKLRHRLCMDKPSGILQHFDQKCLDYIRLKAKNFLKFVQTTIRVHHLYSGVLHMGIKNCFLWWCLTKHNQLCIVAVQHRHSAKSRPEKIRLSEIVDFHQ